MLTRLSQVRVSFGDLLDLCELGYFQLTDRHSRRLINTTGGLTAPIVSVAGSMPVRRNRAKESGKPRMFSRK